MSKPLVIIKLGGSIVADKEAKKPTPRITIIRKLSKQVKLLHKTNKWQIIIVHGAGSFGHPLAKKYNLQNGMKTIEEKIGFCLTDQSMLSLNAIIMNSLLRHSTPVVSLPARSFVRQSAGKLQGFNTKLIQLYLKQNQLPVLFGDVVLDDKWGCSILSGDTIVSYLAKKLKAEKILFLSDVDGIYERDPNINPQAKRINSVNNGNINQVLEGITLKNKEDVTGEMKGKILSIKKNLKGMEVVIASGLKSRSLSTCLTQKTVGTRLYFAKS